MKRIVFTFKEDGSVSSDAEGFADDECLKATDKLLEGLNAQVQNRRMKVSQNATQKQKDRITIHE